MVNPVSKLPSNTDRADPPADQEASRAQVVERPFFAPERRRATPPAEF